MDVGRFQGILNGLISNKTLQSKDLGKTGPASEVGKNGKTYLNSNNVGDTVDINFNKLQETTAKDPKGDIAKIVNDVNNMSMEEAQAAFKNPEIFNKLVGAGVLE